MGKKRNKHKNKIKKKKKKKKKDNELNELQNLISINNNEKKKIIIWYSKNRIFDKARIKKINWNPWLGKEKLDRVV